MPINSRGVPTITPDKTKDPSKLYQYLQQLERQLSNLISYGQQYQSPGTYEIDLNLVRDALSATGTHPLNLEGLVGTTADNQLASLLIESVDPPVDTYPVGTLLVLTGSPDTFKYLKAGVPNVWQSISTTPSNMMTTDTNQTPGATVVKTWTARQVYNGGLDSGAQIHVTAGGIDVDAGGINIDAGGLTVAAGGVDVTGTTDTDDLQVDVNANINGTLSVGGETSLGAYLVGVQGVSSTPTTISANVTYAYVNVAGAATVNLPASPNTGRVLVVKDNSGAAGANNITVSGNGKNIDGAASVTINTNYGFYVFIYNGTQYNIIG